MLKKVIMSAFTALSLGAILSLNTGTAEAASNIKINEAGNVLLIADQEKADGITSVQLSLKVDSAVDADVSFEFNSENDLKISEYRYHDDTNCLNIYIADSKPLFDGEGPLDIGAVYAMDIDGNAVDVQIEVVENSLKYVYQTTLMEDEFEVEIATKPPITTETTSSTTTTTTSTTTSATKPAATTSTTTTAKPAATTPTATTTEPTATTPTTTAVNNGHIASDDDLCKWTLDDYKKRTGIKAADVELIENSEGMYEITLSDEEGKVLDIYTIDPDTGTGTNSANEEVNLPQTGNGSMKKILIVLGALTLIGLGFYIVKISGVIRREGYEK